MSLYTGFYVLNVYIDMRRAVIVIYVLQSLYSTECRPIYEASRCSWPIEFTYDVQVYEIVRLQCLKVNNMENVFQLNKRINYLHAFLMTVSSACTRTIRVIWTGDQNSTHAPHLCNVKTDIRIQSVGSVVCLQAQTHRQGSHFPVRFPFKSVRRVWERSRISIP